ncbi:MAG: hypothetical protein GY810_28445 [Aureispira sp.]|nr:hypothetical protein [Aureispira sp.]
MGRSIAVIWLSLLLSGCFGSSVREPEIVYQTRPIVCDVTKPKIINILRVRPGVVQDAAGLWWVSLDGKSYSNLAVNNKEVVRYIKDVQGYANTLKACIENTKKGG